MYTLPGHTSSIRTLCAFPDGRLVSGSRDKTIRVWQLPYKKLGHDHHSKGENTESRESLVIDVTMSHSAAASDLHGEYASMSMGPTVGTTTSNIQGSGSNGRKDSHTSKQPLCIGLIEGLDMGVYAVCCLNNGNVVVSSEDHIVKLWSFSTQNNHSHYTSTEERDAAEIDKLGSSVITRTTSQPAKQPTMTTITTAATSAETSATISESSLIDQEEYDHCVPPLPPNNYSSTPP